MKGLHIASLSLRRMFRDRSNIFFVLVFPLLLVLLLGSAFGASTTPRVGVVGLGDGEVSERLVAAIEDGDLTVVPMDSESAMRDDVGRGFLSAGVLVPPDLEELWGTRPLEIPVVVRPEARALAARASIEAAVGREAARAMALALATGTAEVGATNAGVAVDLAERALPEVAVRTTTVGEGDPLEEEFVGLGRFDIGASSQLFLFTFLTGLAAGAALIETRELGVSRRIFATPTSLGQQVLGTAGGRVLVAIFQALYIVLATLLLFGVDWGDPFATGLVVLLFCLVSGGAGTLLGAALRTSSQASGVAVGLGLGAAALGGSMAPLEIFPTTVRTIAHVTPHAWANGAMAEIVRRGGGVADVWVQLVVLAGFALAFLGLAAWRLRATLTR